MRGRSLAMIAAAILVTLVPGCGSGEPPASPGELFGEYARSTDVRNDRFPNGGGSSEDRLANFASMGTPDQVAARLLRAYDCGDGATTTNQGSEDWCEVDGRVSQAAREFAGDAAKLFGRSVLVKHEDGQLELVTFYVVQRADGSARVIDRTGATYTDLEDFRSGNDLLDHGDAMLTLRNITSVPGEGDIVVVSGHTASTWQWWLLGGLAALAVLGAGAVIVRRLRAARHPDPLLSPLEFKED
jgi:hypothetical protein